MSDFLFRHRDSLSAAAAATFVLMLATAGRMPATQQPAAALMAIEVMLEPAQQITPSPPPEVIPPPLPLPAARLRKPAAMVAVPRANVESGKHDVPPAVAVDRLRDPVPLESAVDLPAVPPPAAVPAAAPARTAAAVPDALPPLPAEKPGTSADAEADYVGRVKAHLQASKRYPTGREASLQRPAGTAVIWFMVRRSGELAGAGVDISAGSMLLDNAALATVRRSSYPAFPDEVWPGKEQQRFTVELDFVPLN